MLSFSRFCRFARPAVVGAALALAGLAATEAAAYEPLRTCAAGYRCFVVDVLDRDYFWPGQIRWSSRRVKEAWDRLHDEHGCEDVQDVVVGGTLGEDGAPNAEHPGGFAAHLGDRCAMVLDYRLGGLHIDQVDYHGSTNHGRKSLAVLLNRLDRLRTQAGKSGRIQVWGHSKGAAIVESTWYKEAYDEQVQFVGRRSNGEKRYIDACPSNSCQYFGFGYPRGQELASPNQVSVDTAEMHGSTWDKYIIKPKDHYEGWRLTSFTNLGDPIYECSADWLPDLGAFQDLVENAAPWVPDWFVGSLGWSPLAEFLAANINCLPAMLANCHQYENFIERTGYDDLHMYNRYGRYFVRKPEYVGNCCGSSDPAICDSPK